MILLSLVSSLATAGTGPWTLDSGDHNVYVGGTYSQFRNIGRPGADPARLGTGLNSAELVGVWTGGVVDGLDVEFVLPFKRAWAGEVRVPFCVQGRPDDWCAPTGGLANVGVHLRLRLLDERAFRPVSVSGRLGLRSGASYADRRGRLTTLGDGQTDLGAGIAIGRTDTVGKAWYRVSAAADYWLRFKLAEVDGRRMPGDEVAAGIDAMGSPVPWVGIGASASGFHRLWGVSLGEITLGDRDAWISLAATHVRFGPKLAFYTSNNWTFFSTVQFTAYARNTPSDMTLVSAGIGKYFKKKPDPSLELPVQDPAGQHDPGR